MKLDLHIHTTASDGSWTPEEVVAGAAAGGLDLIAIADHDTTAAVATAQEVGRSQRVQVIPALEVSSTQDGRDIHVLGYFVDPESPAMTRHGQRAGARREERMREMIDRLAEQGVEVDYEEVVTAAGPGARSIGRPHLARVLVDRGFATSVPESFVSLIGDRSPAFVPTHLMTPGDAIRLILEAGGIPIWAHPPRDLVDTLLPSLVADGLAGLEVYRPTHRRDRVIRYERICRTAGLLMSGGSDWHNPDSGVELGDFFVTADEVEAFLEAGGC
jgi:3',5'-nucleoside bisphosphate phosphatase